MKRLLSLLLALALLIGMLPAQANAETLDNGLVHEVYTWLLDDPGHIHEYTPVVTDPSCTTAGYTTYTCSCGDSYVADRVDALGHDYRSGYCTRCLFRTDFEFTVYEDHVEITDYYGYYDVEAVIPSEYNGKPVTAIGAEAFSWSNNLRCVIVPDSVTSIGDSAFLCCEILARVELPDSITHIGDSAFLGCISLGSIDFPKGITSIGDSTFLRCDSLNTVYIPEGITSIGDSAFYSCDNLSYVSIPNSVTSIGEEAFSWCESLYKIDIPGSVTSFGDRAFYNCDSLTSIGFKNGVTHIGNSAFSDCDGLTSVFIPGGVTTIGRNAFSDCDSLTRVDLQEGVTSIGDYAFYQCKSLANVNLPDSVTHIGEHAFYDCDSLTSIDLPDSITCINDFTFDCCSNLSRIDLPDQLTTISDHAFSGCIALTSIEIPAGVTSIGKYAFFSCWSLASIRFAGNAPEFASNAFSDVTATAYYPPENATWTEDVMQNYGGDLTWLPYVPHTHEYTAAVTAPTCTEQGYTTYTCSCGDSYVVDYVDPLWHDYVDGVCTRCGRVKDPSDPCDGILAPEDILTRGTFFYALWNYFDSPEPVFQGKIFTDVSESDYYFDAVCWAVENGITGGISATQFGPNTKLNRAQAATFLWRAMGSPEPSTYNPFYDVYESEFYYSSVLWAWAEGYMRPMSDTEFGVSELCLYGHINWVSYDPGKVPGLIYETYSDHVEIIDYTGSAKKLVIPAEIEGLPVTAIGDFAFDYCTSLTSIDLPDSLTSIGSHAFAECSNLTSIDLPDSITFIGSYAFALCTELTGIEIPASVSSIEEGAFFNCLGLTSIDLPESLTCIGGIAFGCCYHLEQIFFLGDAPEIGNEAFSDVTATAYYPVGNPAWTEDIMQDYGGSITWVAHDPAHEYEAVVTDPTCTSQGFTTYTCFCGNSYVADHIDPLGHDYAGVVCTRCGDIWNPFTDVPDYAFYAEPVLWAIEKGITNGTSENSFSPDDRCLRAQVVTFLWRANGCPEPTTTDNPFTDVKEDDFFYKAVLWAVENHITNGTSDTTFGSYDVCNRAQVVTFLHRAKGSPAPGSAELPFTDVPADAWYAAPVVWALENRITVGMTATEFGPNSACNRAQVVTFLYRAYNN